MEFQSIKPRAAAEPTVSNLRTTIVVGAVVAIVAVVALALL